MLDDTATVCLRGSRMSRPNTGVCDCVLRGAVGGVWGAG